MAWDFETDPEFRAKLEWADAFVRDEVEPLDPIWPHQQFTPLEGARRAAVEPLEQRVREQGLWATHIWPTQWIPRRLEAARAEYARYLENEVGNL